MAGSFSTRAGLSVFIGENLFFLSPCIWKKLSVAGPTNEIIDYAYSMNEMAVCGCSMKVDWNYKNKNLLKTGLLLLLYVGEYNPPDYKDDIAGKVRQWSR